MLEGRAQLLGVALVLGDKAARAQCEQAIDGPQVGAEEHQPVAAVTEPAAHVAVDRDRLRATELGFDQAQTLGGAGAQRPPPRRLGMPIDEIDDVADPQRGGRDRGFETERAERVAADRGDEGEPTIRVRLETVADDMPMRGTDHAEGDVHAVDASQDEVFMLRVGQRLDGCDQFSRARSAPLIAASSSRGYIVSGRVRLLWRGPAAPLGGVLL